MKPKPMTVDEAAAQIKRFGAASMQKALRRWREEVNLSQQELASLANVSQQTISFLENEERNLTPEVFVRVFTAIDKAHEKKLAAAASRKGFDVDALLGRGPYDFSEAEKSVTRLFGSRENLLEILELGKELARKDRLIESCDRLINKQAEQILILKELVSAHQDLSSEQDATIRDLERRIAELREEVATARETILVGAKP